MYRRTYKHHLGVRVTESKTDVHAIGRICRRLNRRHKLPRASFRLCKLCGLCEQTGIGLGSVDQAADSFSKDTTYTDI